MAAAGVAADRRNMLPHRGKLSSDTDALEHKAYHCIKKGGTPVLMKHQRRSIILSNPCRRGTLVLVTLLALGGCGVPTQSSSGVPAILPPTVTAATRASAAMVSPTSASAVVTAAPAPNTESPTTQIS